ncbi:hypothetical protein ACJEC8_00450 [Candidatus Carsonella ruddii]|uniref:hypothetical protein n=1 Tax=Carsonella ruddii TaxID=114186 RepID=UPI003D50C507
MKKKFFFIISNKINCVSNFYNFLIQINLKIKLLKIKNLKKNHLKILFINDSFYKINHFLKLLSKCTNILKTFSFKNINLIFYNNIIFNKKIKFYKNFIFIIFINKIFTLYNFKKIKYVLSILNNCILYNFLT